MYNTHHINSQCICGCDNWFRVGYLDGKMQILPFYYKKGVFEISENEIPNAIRIISEWNNRTHQHNLVPGYAETSTKRRPKQPETIIVGESECRSARYVSNTIIDGNPAWGAFKIPGKKRYYFQYRP